MVNQLIKRTRAIPIYDNFTITKRVELQNEVLKSIDETIFQFLAKEHRNNQIEENNELEAYTKAIKEGRNPKMIMN